MQQKKQPQPQPQPQLPSQPQSFLKLGLLILHTDPNSLTQLSDYQQALHNMRLECKSEDKEGQRQRGGEELHQCRIQCVDEGSGWYRAYNLVVCFVDKKEEERRMQDEKDRQEKKERIEKKRRERKERDLIKIEKQSEQKGSMKSEQSESDESENHRMKTEISEQFVILRIQISSPQIQLTNLYNMTQKNIIKLSKPCIMPQPNPNPNSTSIPLHLTIHICPQFLLESTKKYKKFTKQTKQINQNQPQYSHFNDRLIQIISDNSDCKNQQNCIKILKYVIRENDVCFGMEHVRRVKEMRCFRGIKGNGDLFNHRLRRSYQGNAKGIFQEGNGEGEKDTKIMFQKILSLNFLKEQGESVEAFDIDINVELKQINPQGFAGKLKSYQSRALHWMLQCEGQGDQEIGIDRSHTPFWWNAGSDLGLKQPLLINHDLCFISWGQKVLKEATGGILADEMGMGKTIMIIALILAHRPKQDNKTLIIAPLALIKQWQQQISLFAPFLRVHIVNQETLQDYHMNNSDVVIVTEGKIRGKRNKKGQYAHLIDYHWFRIVVDQAHVFKNHKGKMAQNLLQLHSKYRWCLTGTPIQNSPHDLIFFMKFLRFSPWCFEEFWEANFPSKDPNKFTIAQLLKIKQILKGITLRRKKQSIDTQGKKLLTLPQLNTKIRFVKMQNSARKLYHTFNYKAVQQMIEYDQLKQQIATSDNSNKQHKKQARAATNYKKTRIWSLMTRMRMICCHEFMASYQATYVTKENFVAEYLKFLDKSGLARQRQRQNKKNLLFFGNSEEMKAFHQSTQKMNRYNSDWNDIIREICLGAQYQCGICSGDSFQVITPCLHVFCKACIEQKVYQQWKQSTKSPQSQTNPNSPKNPFKQHPFPCPKCGQNFKLIHLFNMPRINEFNRPITQFRENNKIKFILEYIRDMRYLDKVLIFTAFVGMLGLINYSLTKEGVNCVHISGSDSMEERHKRITEFNTNPNVIALIITLKTGAIGLNLSIANKIIFVDPWWNPAVEQQAIGRTHRLGQQKQVEAIKLITQESIEARVVKRAISKKQVSDLVLDIDDIENDNRYSSSHHDQIRYLLEMDEDKSVMTEIMHQLKNQPQLQMNMQQMEKRINSPTFYQQFLEDTEKMQQQRQQPPPQEQ